MNELAPDFVKNPREVEMANQLRQLLSAIDVDATKPLYTHLFQALEQGGLLYTQWYVSQPLSAKQFREEPDEVIAFLEEHIFDAGPSRIEQKTPWNASRMDASMN